MDERTDHQGNPSKYETYTPHSATSNTRTTAKTTSWSEYNSKEKDKKSMINAMIDSGATEDFIDQGLCDKYQIPTRKAKKSREVYLADGQPSDIGPITHTAETTMTIGSHQEYATFQAANLEHHEAILGIPWVRKHNPRIDWANGQLKCESNLCINRCLEGPPTVEAVPEAQA